MRSDSRWPTLLPYFAISIEFQGVAVGNRVSESTQGRGRVGKGGVIAFDGPRFGSKE